MSKNVPAYACGRPHDESDVDMLVVTPASDVVNMVIRICLAFDWFLREIVEKGFLAIKEGK